MKWNQRIRAVTKSFLPGRSEGSTLIELAVCLPVAMMMTLGFIYFSLLVLGMCSNAFAARAATRYATLHSSTSSNPTTQAALNAIVARYAISYPTNTTIVSYSYGTLGNTIGQPVTVIVIVIYSMSIFGTTYNSPELNWGSVGIVVE
jgi:Flp pilus assembly protein TadG